MVDDGIAHQEVRNIIMNANPRERLLHAVELFNVHRGKNIGEGKKSLAFHLEFSSKERTLTGEEVDKEMKRIVEALERIGATIR